MSKFKPGDLVKIKEGMHEEGMGDRRYALVISEVLAKNANPNPKAKFTSIYNIKMLNGYCMKVHEMFLEKINA